MSRAVNQIRISHTQSVARTLSVAQRAGANVAQRAGANVAQRVRAEIGRGEPFRTPEEAWFWTMSALTARREGTRYSPSKGVVKRPCDPDDVVLCLDMLYRSRRIDLVHARILRAWGERGVAPDPTYAGERSDHRFWKEAMDRLEWPLRVKGIVA